MEMENMIRQNTESSTAWRKLLDKDWQELNSKIDWMAAPGMYGHVSAVMGNVNWVEYARDFHLLPLRERLYPGTDVGEQGLNIVSIGCGQGLIEKYLFESGWPIGQILCLDYDSQLLEAAKENLSPFQAEKNYAFFDLDNPLSFNFGQFDVVFFSHSMHHCFNVEDLLKFVNRTVRSEGIILGIDYFGPARFQIPFENLVILQELFSFLPERLRYNISKNVDETVFQSPSLHEIIAHDKSEAPRSADLRGLFFGNFPVIDYRPMGGTLLRPIFTFRSGNFLTPEDITIVKLLQYIEKMFIQYRIIQSDDIFFVCGRSERL